MGKKAKKYQKDGAVFYMNATEATLAQMPKYNGHACGTGAHGDRKYNRRKAEREFRRNLDT